MRILPMLLLTLVVVVGLLFFTSSQSYTTAIKQFFVLVSFAYFSIVHKIQSRWWWASFAGLAILINVPSISAIIINPAAVIALIADLSTLPKIRGELF